MSTDMNDPDWIWWRRRDSVSEKLREHEEISGVRVPCYTCGRWVHVTSAEYQEWLRYWMCEECLARERAEEQQEGTRHGEAVGTD